MGLLDLDYEPYQSFEEYRERFKKHYAIRREDGIIEVRMADEDGNCTAWYPEHKHGWAPLLDAVGADKGNEVLILGGSGEKWVDSLPLDYLMKVRQTRMENPGEMRDFVLTTFRDVPRVFQSLLWNVDIPTIGVINGPGEGHMELALMCDIVLMADNAELSVIHYPQNTVPGDGMYAVLDKTVGTARANLLALTGATISAAEALDWGLVSEVVPQERCYERAWELARLFMAQGKATRMLTHDLMRASWREYVSNKYRSQAALETMGIFYGA